MKEIWKDIQGYEGRYQVSNLGRVKSLNRKRWNGYTFANLKGKILKLRHHKDKDYLSVILYDGHRNGKTIETQRLVAQAFIPNPNNLPCVNHKDENPQNNKALNLEWCDYHYNNNYGNHNLKLSLTRQKKKYKIIAIRNGKKASKKVKQLDLNGKLLHIYPSQTEAARKTGSKRDGISDCCRGKHKSHNGYLWEYA